jgi:hypothetical protein
VAVDDARLRGLLESLSVPVAANSDVKPDTSAHGAALLAALSAERSISLPVERRRARKQGPVGLPAPGDLAHDVPEESHSCRTLAAFMGRG